MLEPTDKILAGIGLMALALLLLAIAPLAYIWSWNQMFGSFHMLDYTFKNWLAAFVLSSFFKMYALPRKHN